MYNVETYLIWAPRFFNAERLGGGGAFGAAWGASGAFGAAWGASGAFGAAWAASGDFRRSLLSLWCLVKNVQNWQIPYISQKKRDYEILAKLFLANSFMSW